MPMTNKPEIPERAAWANAWQSAGVTHSGKIRRVNEDSFIQRPEIGLWCVADGMGGHQAGDVASGMIVEALREIDGNLPFPARLDQIDDTLEAVNRELVERGNSATGKGMMGSTAVILAVDPDGLAALLWVGDSRIYRYRNQALEQLSTDHSQVEQYVEQGLISREEAATHPESNVITRALGSAEDEVLEAELCDVAAGDRFLLCSDGLIRHIGDDELATFLAEGDAETACARLLDCTLDRGAVDNTTVIVVDIMELA